MVTQPKLEALFAGSHNPSLSWMEKMASRSSLLTSTLILWLALISSSRAENVTLSVYYETLCPYCADFIANHLTKVFENGLVSIINLRMIPWGNALISPDGSFACQHGHDECVLNSIDACSIAIYPDVIRHFNFISCVERLGLENKLNEWVTCFGTSGLSEAPIINCYTSGLGERLEQQHAVETAKLNPPHRFVPWVVVNDQALQEDFSNFQSYICNAYSRGGANQLPEACSSIIPSPNDSLQKEENPNSQVCYMEETTNFTSPPAPDMKSITVQLKGPP